MNHLFKGFVAVLVTILIGMTAGAQVTTSSINGQVRDNEGEPLAGAAIIALHVPSGTQYAAVANEEGRFFINGMRSGGPYTLEISFLGMATVRYEAVILSLGEPYEVIANMKASNELDAVVLLSESSFNANKTGAGSSYNLETIESTPTIDRSIYDVVKYTPQASMKMDEDGVWSISFAGSNNRYNSFQIDGAVANDAFGLSASGTNGGQAGANPVSLDAIEEIQVVVAPFDVRQSGFTGGAINAVTKSGTNAVKGSFYSYFNNQDFMGTTPGKIGDGEKRSKYDTQNKQTYGFTVGGPIIKNKLFFFASAEYNRKSSPNIYTPANGSYDDMTLRAEVQDGGTSLGTVFNPAMAEAIIKHYEKTFGIKTGESYSQHQIKDRSLSAMARIDWNINDDNRLMVRYQFSDASADKYGSVSAGYYFNNSSYLMSNRTHTAVVELNSRISDSVSNEFRATGVFVRDGRTIPYAGPNVMINDKVIMSIGTEKSSGANAMHSDVYTISDNLSIFKGNHNITVGTHNEFFRFYNVFLQCAYGQYTYKTVADFFNNTPSKFDYRYADPALTGGDTRWGATTYAAQFGLYAQDEWKPNRDFTLTYGLRMDMPVLLNKPTANDAFNASDIAKNNTQYVGVIPKANLLFSPRVGFRWFIDEEHKSLLRGGAGLFTGMVPFVWLANAYNNTGMESKGLTVNNPDGSFPLTANPYKDIIESGIASATGKATINTMSENFKYPQVFRANLGFEKSFGYGWKFTFDALYSKTLNNVFFENLALTKTGVVYGVNEAAAASNSNIVAPRYSIDNTYQAVVALRNTNKGYSYSLSGQIEKNFDFGLNLMASYTFGHSYSVNDGLSSVAASNWEKNHSVASNSSELSYSSFDRPHRVMATVSYTSPVYLNILRTTVSLSYTGISGQRFSYIMNEQGTEDFSGDGAKSNSLLYIPTKNEVAMMSWTNPADAEAFEQYIQDSRYLSSHRGGWAERYGAMNPFEHHFDLHVAQDFYYDKKNGRKLQLIVDFLNISNLLNRNWGLYYSYSRGVRVLKVDSLSADSSGNYTPTYSLSPDKTDVIEDLYSRWRCQLGLRLTF